MKCLNWRVGGVFLAAVFILGTIGLYKIEAASAQLSISVYPLLFKADIDPGQSWEGTVTVVNPNDFPIGAVAEKENIAGGAEGEVSLIGDTDTEYGLSSWVTFEDVPGELQLEAHERRPIKFKVNIPVNAQPGGHYGSVLFRAIPAKIGSSTESGVAISGRVGAVLLFEVSGDVKKSGLVTDINAPKFLSHGPIDLSFKVKNDGNTFFLPEGKVEFRNLWRKFDGVWEPRVVFPGFDRTFKTSWPSKYFIGPVTVKVVSNMQNGPALPEKSMTIWVFPWQEAIILLGLVLIAFIAWKVFLKNFKIVRVENPKS